MMKYFLMSVWLVLGWMLSVNGARAQQNWQASIDPGYYLVNSDHVFQTDAEQQLHWSLGGRVAHRFNYKGFPLQLSVGVSYAKNQVVRLRGTDELRSDQTIDVDLRQLALPLHLWYLHTIKPGVEAAFGVNLVPMHRVLSYQLSNLSYMDSISNDRIFCLGAGLSGRIQADLWSLGSSGNMLFASLSVRWTEFIYNQARGRNLDNFYVRHLSISPGFGVKFKL